MSDLEELIDINKVSNQGDERQNPIGGNVIYSGSFPTLEIFEEIQEKDRAGRARTKLNLKAQDPWEARVSDVGQENCGSFNGVYPKIVKALKHLDGVQGATDSIQQIEDSWMAVGLTQAKGGVHSTGITLKDSGGQSLCFIGDTTKSGAYLDISYKRNLPEVGDLIKCREDGIFEYERSELIEEISYSPTKATFTYSSEELIKDRHYVIEVSGKCTKADGSIIDGNYVVPLGVTADARVSGFGVFNSHGVNISSTELDYNNGGTYKKSFQATENSKIGFRLEDLDISGNTGTFSIKLYSSKPMPLVSDIRASGDITNISSPFNKEGQAIESYEVISIDEDTNQMVLRRSDRASVDPTITTHIIAPTLGKWWASDLSDLSLEIDGKSDDSTSFNYTTEIESGEDLEDVDLFGVRANLGGLWLSYNGRTWVNVTTQECYSLSTGSILIGDATNTTEVLGSSTAKERYVRHFEWLFFDNTLQEKDFLNIFSYLRCKYGYPWDNGTEALGDWKECVYMPPPNLKTIDPPIITCCFTNFTYTFQSASYATIHEPTNTCVTWLSSATWYGNGTHTKPVVTTDASGNTGMGVEYGKKFCQTNNTVVGEVDTWTWNIYGPFYFQSSSQTEFPVACDDIGVLVDGRANKEKLEFAKNGTTYLTTIEAVANREVTETIYQKPPSPICKIGSYAEIGNITGRVTGITTGATGTTYGIKNLHAKNQALLEGSQTTTGSTTGTSLNCLVLKCSERGFGGKWTYKAPVHESFTYAYDTTFNYSTITSILSSTTSGSKFPPVAIGFGVDFRTMIPSNYYTTYVRWVKASVLNTFETTAQGTSTKKGVWYANPYTTTTQSTSELAFVGADSYFASAEEIDFSDQWISMGTKTIESLAPYTTEVEAFSYNITSRQYGGRGYMQCFDSDTSFDLRFWDVFRSEEPEKALSYLNLYEGNVALYGWDVTNERKILQRVLGEDNWVAKYQIDYGKDIEQELRQEEIQRKREEARIGKNAYDAEARNGLVNFNGRQIKTDAGSATSSTYRGNTSYVKSHGQSPDSTLIGWSSTQLTSTWETIERSALLVTDYAVQEREKPYGDPNFADAKDALEREQSKYGTGDWRTQQPQSAQDLIEKWGVAFTQPTWNNLDGYNNYNPNRDITNTPISTRIFEDTSVCSPTTNEGFMCIEY